jgi:hypothetical protein
MRAWTLGPGDPLALTLAADFRLCNPDYVNDHIWELEIGSGDPPALSLRTTYGLRARLMRLFPRFSLGPRTISDPGAFVLPPRLRRFHPNTLLLDFSPFPDLEVLAEYWTPISQAVAGRFKLTNGGAGQVRLLFELCGQLFPLEGQSLTIISRQMTHLLAGQSSNLSPVVFLTGGPQPGPGPYSSLAVDLTLAAGESRTFTWVQAALATTEDSFDLARRIATRPWDAEMACIEMVNAAQTVEVYTGDLEWDAAFALSQKIAFGLFFGPSRHLPHPSFVLTRQPDQGYSVSGDGSDYPHLWSGQPALEACTLSSLLSGAPQLAAGLVRNFLATRSEDGALDWKPGLAGQRGRWLAAPLLVSLAWQTFQHTRDLDFLREIQPGLESFTRCWFNSSHDRDSDGFPEWDHPLQCNLDEHPAYSVWQDSGQGGAISAVESPALAALLCREARAHALIAEALNQPGQSERWKNESDRLRLLVEECWDVGASLYHVRDRDTHLSPAGKFLASRRGPGILTLGVTFKQPARLLVRLDLKGVTTHRPEVRVSGQNGEILQSESIDHLDFQWGAELAVATTRKVYTSLGEVEVAGLMTRDRISISVMDFRSEDVTLFLPLLAGIPDPDRANKMVNQTLFAADRFGGRFGFPLGGMVPVPADAQKIPPKKRAMPFKPGSPPVPQAVTVPLREAVLLPWNILIGEGLIGYGLREEAALLTCRLMQAVIQNLKQQHAFARVYNVSSGAGMGERNPVQGLAPLGLFLDTLGVRIESPRRVVLNGKNPFPWPVTVKYRGLTVTRQADQTVVVFPDEQTVTMDNSIDTVVVTN